MRRVIHSLPIALLTACLVAGTGVAHAAGGVPTLLHGKVANFSNVSADNLSKLAALGVVPDALVVVSYRVDPTAAKGSSPNPAFSNYPSAVTEMEVTIGSYHATQALPTIELDHVQVGNNVSGSDSYLLQTVGHDTDNILAGSVPGAFISTLLSFFDGNGSTIKDDGPVQNAKKFPFATANTGGANGFINFNFDAGGGGGTTGPGPGLAQKGQLIAASKFGRSLLKIFAKSASSLPTFDPFGAKKAASIDAAEEKFATAFVKAVDKALKKGGTAPLPASSQGLATDNLKGNILPLEAQLLTGANADDKADRALRGKLFRAAAAQCGADLTAFGNDAKKPNSTTLANKLAKSRSTLLTRITKAIEAAGKKGITYSGPSGAEISGTVRTLAEEFNGLTQGITASLAEALAASDQYVRSVGGTVLRPSF